MTNEGSSQENFWPTPKFYFSVKFGSQDNAVSFQEVSGLETETQIIEYRHGNSPRFSTIKMPGIVKTGNVILKKGVFVNDNAFFTWFDAIKMNTIQRENVTIRLLDENGRNTMIWSLANAWPIKISGTDLKSDATEVCVETLELAHEGITITNARIIN